MLSMGGKETLINTVAQAIPFFAMTVFNIQKNCKEITDAILQFWWDKNMEDARVVESSSDWLELKVWIGNYPSLCNEAMISYEKMHSVRIVACHSLF
jgi:hypothetical protein